MPALKKVYDRFHEKGFDVVGVSLDSQKEAWRPPYRSSHSPWHQLSDLKGWNCVLAQKYGITSIPVTVLFDPEGKVVTTGINGNDLSKFLDDNLK